MAQPGAEGFDPTEVTFEYTEANGWQYNFFMPHDISGHMDLLGGPEAYADRLQDMFGASSEMTGRHQSDITGLIGQYAHGNAFTSHVLTCRRLRVTLTVLRLWWTAFVMRSTLPSPMV